MCERWGRTHVPEGSAAAWLVARCRVVGGDRLCRLPCSYAVRPGARRMERGAHTAPLGRVDGAPRERTSVLGLQPIAVDPPVRGGHVRCSCTAVPLFLRESFFDNPPNGERPRGPARDDTRPTTFYNCTAVRAAWHASGSADTLSFPIVFPTVPVCPRNLKTLQRCLSVPLCEATPWRGDGRQPQATGAPRPVATAGNRRPTLLHSRLRVALRPSLHRHSVSWFGARGRARSIAP